MLFSQLALPSDINLQKSIINRCFSEVGYMFWTLKQFLTFTYGLSRLASHISYCYQGLSAAAWRKGTQPLACRLTATIFFVFRVSSSFRVALESVDFIVVGCLLRVWMCTSKSRLAVTGTHQHAEVLASVCARIVLACRTQA
jgi:hypothetical protein